MLVFRSRVDTLLAIFFVALFIAPIITLLHLDSYDLRNEDMLAALVMLATAIFCGLLVVKIKYVVKNGEVHIHAPFFNRTIAIKNIRKVTEKTSWMSGPALSSKRLVLHCSIGEVEISPKQQAEFLKAIDKTLSDSI